MKPIKKIGLLIALCLSQLFIQCNTDDNKVIEEKIVAEQYTDEVILLRDFLSKSLPMDIKKIIYDSDLSAFTIDGDVLMPLEQARGHYSHSILENTNKIKQMFSGYSMTPEMAKSIQVYISPEVTVEWRIATDKAIKIWNNTNSSINITTVTTSTSLSVKIIMGHIVNRATIANAYYPYNGAPGTRVMISTNHAGKLNNDERIHTMIHELGHIFGLAHTNRSYGSLIPCTPFSEMESIMFPMVEESITFTIYDNIAISTLYPVAVGTKKLYRYKKDQYYFYTTDACEITPDKDGYVFDGDAGYLYSKQITGTVPLYRILNGTTVKDHRLNKIQTSSSDVILGYLYLKQQPGTTALYSYGIYEARGNETPSYMYHYMCTITNSDAILKNKIGYVPNKLIIEETPKYPILF